MDSSLVKHEILEEPPLNQHRETSKPIEVIDLSSSEEEEEDEDSDSDDSDDSQDENQNSKRSRVSNGGAKKKRKKKKLDIVLPFGFLDPLPVVEQQQEHEQEHEQEPSLLLSNGKSTLVACQKVSGYSRSRTLTPSVKGSKQFWKAGDYEGDGVVTDLYSSASTGGMDHVRVHPKFLHSNATSHKWALGAFAELLDNSLDEICNGATFAKIDMLENRKDKSKMLLIEDNGGGMDPDKMRQCMSLGYSAKSKMANTIGQYGNGFKTSTMRLGADVIVFSRSRGKDGKSPTQSIGLLSYTFLRSTGKEDIVVPMLDYEKEGREWHKLIRSSPDDWNRNVETIIDWSPYSNEAELLHQFNLMKDQGTCVIIYNLWDNDQGQLELDFDTNRHDIQIGGVNRDEKKIEMAKHFPNSRHFLTYQHSLRSYASILYLRLPPGFRIVLRGKDVEHHNLVNDMMQTQEVTYRPVAGVDGVIKDTNVVATVTMGFVKDAKDHIDVQGFNVYHKNRLIKPFWRVWNPAGSDGRGVIGVLEANFVEPAHDKQGFERTTVLSRLEARLVILQKQYWSKNCHKIGYAPRVRISDDEKSAHPRLSPNYFGKRTSSVYSKSREPNNGNNSSSSEPASVVGEYDSDCEMPSVPSKGRKSSQKSENSQFEQDANGNEKSRKTDLPALNRLKVENHELKDRLKTMEESLSQDLEFERDRRKLLEALVNGKSSTNSDAGYAADLKQLQLENHELKDRLKKIEETSCKDLQHEKDRCKLLEAKLKEMEKKIEELNSEQESLIDLFADERSRRDKEEDNLRKKLKGASNTIQELLDKVRLLERM